MMEGHVLIVGAGPTGLLLACELSRRGVSHRLIERAALPAEGSRGKGLQPRTLEIFEDLDIVAGLIGNGRFDLPVLLHGDGGGALLTQSAAPRDGAPFGATLLTPQWRVEAALRSCLAELGGRVEWGTELVAVKQVGDRVVAQVRHDAVYERIEAGWLVGCDGGQGAVRRSCGVPFVGETFEQIRMWVGDLTVAGLDRDHWHLWRDREAFLALCPLPSTDQFQFQARIDGDERREPSLRLFQELFCQRTGRSDINLTDVGWISTWRANIRLAERFREGRALLAGDAAHVHSPAGAQGMNTGIQDAYNLGWKLAAVVAGADESLLDTYQEERLPIAQEVLALSNELTRTAFSPDLRRDERTLQLDINYRSSGLSVELGSASSVVRAGDRAPDAMGLRGPGGIVQRLFDLLRGSTPIVLVFGGSVPLPLEAALERFGRSVRVVCLASAGCEPVGEGWVDEDGSAWRVYGPGAETVFVVRPDGYVGLTGSTADVAELSDYLSRIVGPLRDPRHAERMPSCSGRPDPSPTAVEVASTMHHPGSAR